MVCRSSERRKFVSLSGTGVERNRKYIPQLDALRRTGALPPPAACCAVATLSAPMQTLETWQRERYLHRMIRACVCLRAQGHLLLQVSQYLGTSTLVLAIQRIECCSGIWIYR